MAHLVCDVEHPAELEAALVEDLVLGKVDLGRVVGLEKTATVSLEDGFGRKGEPVSDNTSAGTKRHIG